MSRRDPGTLGHLEGIVQAAGLLRGGRGGAVREVGGEPGESEVAEAKEAENSSLKRLRMK